MNVCDQGTLIRVFDVSSRRQLTELRRGADTAILYWSVTVSLPLSVCLCLCMPAMYSFTTAHCQHIVSAVRSAAVNVAAASFYCEQNKLSKRLVNGSRKQRD